MARPLTEVDATLGRLRWSCSRVMLGGVGARRGARRRRLAGARTRPVARLTAAAEEVTATGDLHRRIERGRRRRAGPAGGSVQRDARRRCERSRDAQRQLVADASHELRTPLTAIRTNIELLEHARASWRRPSAPRMLRLRRDQLEDLTVLVGDLVDLARR